ncbi:MAG TPA: ATP-binding protein [Saprospiraceae bacterium]|nr:ATP-binding protein [Saprospiraceae bacterium]
MVIIVFGLPGSGKSYFASRLAMHLEAEYVNSDELRMHMLQERNYTAAEKQRVYDAMLSRMSDALSDKKPIVLDATFYKKSIRRRFEQRAATFHHSIIYIEVTASEDIIKDRLLIPRAYSEADYDVYLKLKKSAEPLTRDHLVLVSTNNNIVSMLHEALHYIETQP